MRGYDFKLELVNGSIKNLSVFNEYGRAVFWIRDNMLVVNGHTVSLSEGHCYNIEQFENNIITCEVDGKENDALRNYITNHKEA